jgi:hypothetical protein
MPARIRLILLESRGHGRRRHRADGQADQQRAADFTNRAVLGANALPELAARIH